MESKGWDGDGGGDGLLAYGKDRGGRGWRGWEDRGMLERKEMTGG